MSSDLQPEPTEATKSFLPVRGTNNRATATNKTLLELTSAIVHSADYLLHGSGLRPGTGFVFVVTNASPSPNFLGCDSQSQ